MAIKTDLSDLPTKVQSEGRPPDPEPRFLPVLIDALRDDDDKPTALGTRIRHSDAAKCSRYLAMKAAGGFPFEPMDPAGILVTSIGTWLHEQWQEAMQAVHGSAFEAEVKLRIDGVDASGHSDGRLVEKVADGATWRTTIELKTIGGFGYKMAVGDRGAPEGPRWSAIVQGALNAVADEADELVVALIATEAISKGQAERKGFSDLGRFMATWTFTREQFEPIAHDEAQRWGGILHLLDESGELAARKIPNEMPPGAVIVDPIKGRWEVVEDGKVADTGTTWQCGYCSLRDACLATNEPGRIAVDVARERVES